VFVMVFVVVIQVNGVDVTNARHDDVIRLLTADHVQEFTIVVYRDPNHPLSPTTSPRSLLFMPSQAPVNITTDSSSSYPTSSVVTKRPSPGPELHISTTVGSPRSSAVSFVPRPTSAEAGKFVAKSPLTADVGKSPSTLVKTVTYNIGDSSSPSVEPPMPLMKLHQEMTSVPPRGSSGGVEPAMKISHSVPCHDGKLLLVTPPAPPRTSTGSGVKDLFDALEKTYHASQEGAVDPSRASDVGMRSSVMAGQGSTLPLADKKRHSIDVRLLL